MSKTDKIKLIIAEDHQIFRAKLVEFLNTDSIEVIGEAPNGQVLIELVKAAQPDVVLLDLEMPVKTGHEVLEVFSKEFTGIKTIIFTYDDASYSIASAVLNGACGYLRKDIGPEEVIKAVEAVYRDGYYFNEHMSQYILSELHNRKKLYIFIGDQKFSERELEVIKLLCAEVPAERIADRLNITKNGVLWHKKRLFKKTQSNNIVSLVKYAILHGIINVKKPPPKD